MFAHWKEFNWVRPVFVYDNKEHLLSALEEEILYKAEKWETREEKMAAQRTKLEQLKESNPSLYKQLKDEGVIID